MKQCCGNSTRELVQSCSQLLCVIAIGFNLNTLDSTLTPGQKGLVKKMVSLVRRLGTVVLSLISENPRSRFMLELMLLLCRFRVMKRVARSQLLRLFNDGSDNTALLS